MKKYIQSISFKYELLFILFILANVAKLTAVQWLITQSVYTLSYVLLKNALFLYTVWRIVFLARRKFLFIIVYVIQFLYLTIHTLYFLYSQQTLLLPQFVYSFVEGFTAIKSIYIVLDDPWVFLLFIDIFLFIGLTHFYENFHQRMRTVSTLVIPMMLVLTTAGFYRLGFFSSENILHDSFSRRNFKYGTIFAQVYDLGIDQEDYINQIEYGEIFDTPAKDHLYNVISIQVESLNADIIRFDFEGNPVTPFLKQASEEHIYYPYCLSQHKTGNSSDAEFSVFNSVEALDGYPAAQFTEYEYPNSFVKELENHNKLSFHGNKGDFYNRYLNMELMGFERYWDRLRMGLEEIGWGAPDSEVYDFMIEKMHEDVRPFYFHHITMTSHGPFTNAKYYHNSNFLQNISNDSEKNYLNTFSYVDKSIENFVKEVQSHYPDTYFFIYGDHTAKIDGDKYQSINTYKMDDKLFEFVPLIIITPDGVNHYESNRAVSFLDLAPTILSASGQSSRIKAFGENLIPEPGQYPILEKDIPFFGTFYSREEIYKRIRDIMR